MVAPRLHSFQVVTTLRLNLSLMPSTSFSLAPQCGSRPPAFARGWRTAGRRAVRRAAVPSQLQFFVTDLLIQNENFVGTDEFGLFGFPLEDQVYEFAVTRPRGCD